jgi:peroxiredoxin
VKLQERISEIEKLNAVAIAIATLGNKQDVEKTKKNLELTYILIPTPNRNVGEKYKLKYNFSGAAHATIIIDRKGFMRFKSDDDHATLTSATKIIKELQGI